MFKPSSQYQSQSTEQIHFKNNKHNHEERWKWVTTQQNLTNELNLLEKKQKNKKPMSEEQDQMHRSQKTLSRSWNSKIAGIG